MSLGSTGFTLDNQATGELHGGRQNWTNVIVAENNCIMEVVAPAPMSPSESITGGDKQFGCDLPASGQERPYGFR